MNGRRIGFVSALLAAAALAGCGGGKGGGVGPAAGSPAEQRLAQAEAQWKAANVRDCAFTVKTSCFCPPESTRAKRVTVRGGRPDPHRNRPRDVAALFAVVRDELRHADAVRVEYDARYGFPTSIGVDQEKDAVDDEYGIAVSAFRRGH